MLLSASTPAHWDAARTALDEPPLPAETLRKALIYSPPTTRTDEQRTLTAQSAAAHALGIRFTGPRQWGYQGRPLGQQARHPAHGACGLRLISAPADQANGKLWDGTVEAAAAFPTVHKPALHALHNLEHDGFAFRAELSEFIASGTCSPEPVLRTERNLAPAWWTRLRSDLDTIAATHTTRVAVRQQWIARALPQHAGAPTGHHLLGHGPRRLPLRQHHRGPIILDWEGFGTAPLGYDAAMLYAYSLLAPATAATIRQELPVLNTPVGATALLVVAAALLQSCSRGDHPELADPLRSLVASLSLVLARALEMAVPAASQQSQWAAAAVTLQMKLCRETTPRPAERLNKAILGRTAPAPQHPGRTVMSTGRMLMGAADRRIYAHHTPVEPPLAVSVTQDRPRDRLPRAICGPPAMALIHRLPIPEASRKIAPRQAGALPEENPVDHAPMAQPTSASPNILGQTRFESSPLVIREITPPHTGQNDRPTGGLPDPSDRP